MNLPPFLGGLLWVVRLKYQVGSMGYMMGCSLGRFSSRISSPHRLICVVYSKEIHVDIQWSIESSNVNYLLIQMLLYTR